VGILPGWALGWLLLGVGSVPTFRLGARSRKDYLRMGSRRRGACVGRAIRLGYHDVRCDTRHSGSNDHLLDGLRARLGLYDWHWRDSKTGHTFK
jgi:hypothetical protein